MRWRDRFGYVAEAIRQATGGRVDLMARESERKPATYGTRIGIIGGVCPAFADCGVGRGPDERLEAFLSRRYGWGLGEIEREAEVRAEDDVPLSTRDSLIQERRADIDDVLGLAAAPPERELALVLDGDAWFRGEAALGH